MKMAARKFFWFFFLLQIISLMKCDEDNSVDCGIVSDSDYIVGPKNDPEKNPVGVWPWMASFGFYEDENWIHNCGASLISNNKFITAAHCIKSSESNWQIRVGVFELNVTRRGSLVLDIEKATVHPSYDGTAYFDIGVIETRVIEINKKIRPICLPEEASTDVNKYKYDQMIITGWGASSVNGVTSNVLKRAGVRVLPQKQCNSIHEPLFTKKNLKEIIPRLFDSQLLCAGNDVGHEGSCKGDSGGPMFYLDVEGEVEKYIQVGIVQGSIGQCGDKNLPSIYVRLDDPEILQFLNSQRTGLSNYQTVEYNINDINGQLRYEGSVENEVPSGNGTMLYRGGSKYVGQWSNGQRQGQGIFYYSKEDVSQRSKYVGSWQNDEINGFGTITWTEGEKYEGDYLNGFRHGKGKFVFSNESPYYLSYEGDWIEDKYSGKGVFIWKDGSKYEGDFLNGLLNGKGKLVYSNESPYLSYEGNWVDGNISGKGVFIWKDGSKNEGDFLNGMRHGKGKVVFSNESPYLSYEGDWLEDKKSGKGVFIWKDGSKYEGDYFNDLKHGNGTYFYPPSSVYAKHIGQYENDKRNGRGELYWKNRDKYIGQFKDDNFHGEGIKTSASGQILQQGRWENNAFVD